MLRSELVRDGLPLASLLLRLRRLGRKDMFRVMRSLSMSAREFTEEWFESEPLKAAIGALAIHGVTLGAYSAGTGFTLIHNWLNRGGLAHRPSTGGASLTDALVAALRAGGGELRTSSAVERILVDKQQVQGVRLAGGEEIAARRSSPPPIRARRCSASSARPSCRPSSSGRRSPSACAARWPRCTC